MRTAEDLILELDSNAQGYAAAALIVGFEESTIFVEAENPSRLQLLEQAIALGGEPVGWYRSSPGCFEIGLLTEYADEEWAHKYLKTLRDGIEAAIKEAGR